MDDQIAWMVLSQIPGIGVVTFWTLVNHFGSPEAVLRCSAKQLNGFSGITKKQLKGFAQQDTVRRHCQQQMEKIQNIGGECLSFHDDCYPDSLRQISDPPPLLFLLGNKHLLQSCCIAVVGSRASTSYGNRTAYNLCRKMAGKGVTIVSGLALGIDAESHRGALAAGGSTIGVLGCGVDVIYPRQNAGLFKDIVKSGAIISEYPPGTQPEGFRFPARNRIISGMSNGVVVVEAARKSGSLITAQLAIDEGREVYAVPGQVDSYKSEGTHWLLQQGAKLVQSEKDILEDLNMAKNLTEDGGNEEDMLSSQALGEKTKLLLQCIDHYPVSRDAILAKSGLEIFEFSEHLLFLELEGLVEVLPGDEIRRKA